MIQNISFSSPSVSHYTWITDDKSLELYECKRVKSFDLDKRRNYFIEAGKFVITV